MFFTYRSIRIDKNADGVVRTIGTLRHTGTHKSVRCRLYKPTAASIGRALALPIQETHTDRRNGDQHLVYAVDNR
jgi:hypothetical protein